MLRKWRTTKTHEMKRKKHLDHSYICMLYYGRFIRGVAMISDKSKRKTAIYCPNCGHMEVKARTCDIEMQCRRCNYQFEAVIGPNAEMVCERAETSYGK